MNQSMPLFNFRVTKKLAHSIYIFQIRWKHNKNWHAFKNAHIHTSARSLFFVFFFFCQCLEWHITVNVSLNFKDNYTHTYVFDQLKQKRHTKKSWKRNKMKYRKKTHQHSLAIISVNKSQSVNELSSSSYPQTRTGELRKNG